MATLHIDKTGGGIRRWAAWSAIAAAIGLGVVAIVTGSGASQPASPSTTAAPADLPVAAFLSRKSEDLGRSAVAATDDGGISKPDQPANASPAELQMQARLYVDCQEGGTRRVQGVVSQLDESYAVDPSGALASAYRDAEQRRIEQCRQVGTAEYQQIEPLMQEAARRGEPSARFFLIEQSLRRLTERAAEARALGETDLTADASRTAQAEAGMHELEQMALQGWLPAMKALAGGILSSDQLLPADPLRAAAWNLVASRPPGDDKPLTVQDLEASGTLTPLSAEDSALVVNKAQQLRQACCQEPASGVSSRPNSVGSLR